MPYPSTTLRAAVPRRTACAAWVLAALCLSAASGAAQAQSIVMAGNFQNFDVLNNTGAPTHGFEMEVRGVSAKDLTRIFPSNFDASVIRYGVGTATDFPGGVIVRWSATYQPASGTWSTSTPVPQSLSSVPGESCWTGGMPTTYATAGCEHFGISTTGVNPTSITYRWLVRDPANPGTLIGNATYVNIPAPVWTVVPPANPGLPPVVVAEVQAPPAPPALYGEAQWVKVYKTEHQAKVDLIQLMGDNHAVVPEAAAQLEVGWSLLQRDPPGGNQRRRGKLVNQGNAGNGNHAVVRRYEFYEYAGVYDPITHEALCADLTCTAPGAGDLGNAIGAQNVAANIDVNALAVTVGGSGSVSSSDRVIACGNKCYGVYNPGTTVTLTAKASSGNTFAGWSGACLGNALSCTVTMNAASAVTATFAAPVAGGGGGGGGGGGAAGGVAAGGTSFTLSVTLANAGTVTSTPSGINCGATCSAKYTSGAAVALSALPPPGLTFQGWSGACTGLDPNGCKVTMSANTKVKASFSK